MIYFKRMGFVLMPILAFLQSCSGNLEEDPTFIVGQDFTDTRIRVLSIDTFSIAMSTMKFDSIPTSEGERLLVGQYEDNFMGRVVASSYFKVNSTSFNIDEEAELDSIGLVLGYDNYFYNDTTSVSTLNVHKLTEKFDTDETSFFNTSTIPFDSNPLISIEYLPEPNRDSLYITLPQDFGLEIFQGIQSGEIYDTESLEQQFDGFTIQPGATDNSSIIGFTTLTNRTYLRMFYTTPDELDGEQETFDLTINTTPLGHFNNIVSDVDQLSLSEITDQEFNLSSTKSNNFSYTQAGVGYAARLEFPSIRTIYDISPDGAVLNAVLRIKPSTLAYSDIQPINELLSLFTVDQNNDLLTQVSDGDEFVFAAFTEENSELNEAVYEIPLTAYIEFKLNESPITEEALILITEDYNNSVNKILFNDQFNDDFEAELIITYAIYEDL